MTSPIPQLSSKLHVPCYCVAAFRGRYVSDRSYDSNLILTDNKAHALVCDSLQEAESIHSLLKANNPFIGGSNVLQTTRSAMWR